VAAGRRTQAREHLRAIGDIGQRLDEANVQASDDVFQDEGTLDDDPPVAPPPEPSTLIVIRQDLVKTRRAVQVQVQV
jgi:hypothetical protein